MDERVKGLEGAREQFDLRQEFANCMVHNQIEALMLAIGPTGDPGIDIAPQYKDCGPRPEGPLPPADPKLLQMRDALGNAIVTTTVGAVSSPPSRGPGTGTGMS